MACGLFALAAQLPLIFRGLKSQFDWEGPERKGQVDLARAVKVDALREALRAPAAATVINNESTKDYCYDSVRDLPAGP